jgi:hypothetical protein
MIAADPSAGSGPIRPSPATGRPSVTAALAVVLWAAALGAVVATPIGGDGRRLSVEVWLAVTAIWLTWSVARRIWTATPVEGDALRGLLRLRRTEPAVTRARPRQLQALEGSLIAARDNERAFAHRLRPRLRGVAEHLLRTDHGIDLATDQVGAAAVLGSTAWLIDPSVVDRTPTMADIAQFLDALDRPPS